MISEPSLKSKDIGVIGAGVIELSTAIVLARAGYTVTIYTKDFAAQNVSTAAGAMWLPIWASDPNGVTFASGEQIAKWATRTWDMMVGEVGTACGVQFHPATEMFVKEVAPPEFLTRTLKDLKCTEDLTLPSGHRFRWSFTTLMIEPATYLNYLINSFIRYWYESLA
jgi:D-amino-acid oxidase